MIYDVYMIWIKSELWDKMLQLRYVEWHFVCNLFHISVFVYILSFSLPFWAVLSQFQSLQMLRERLDSDGLHSPVEEEDYTIESHLASPSCTAL